MAAAQAARPVLTWFDTFHLSSPPIAAKQSCTTIPPDPIPPSCRTIANSLSNAPSNASSFWMSALEVVREMMSRSDSLRMISRESSSVSTRRPTPPAAVRTCDWTTWERLLRSMPMSWREKKRR